jgi:non-specific serine/threonine protein kinase
MPHSPPARRPLSPREREVADLVAQGLRRREIAARLGITRGTVDDTLKLVRLKLGIRRPSAKSRA